MANDRSSSGSQRGSDRGKGGSSKGSQKGSSKGGYGSSSGSRSGGKGGSSKGGSSSYGSSSGSRSGDRSGSSKGGGSGSSGGSRSGGSGGSKGGYAGKGSSQRGYGDSKRGSSHGRSDDRGRHDRHDRHDRDDRRDPPPSKRTIITSSGQLPAWVSEDIARTTPRAEVRHATETLAAAAEAFVAGKHGKALDLATEAKSISSRVVSIRELMALSAYRIARWDVALRELRTYRRMSGDSSHVPIEMDVLRALERPDDVVKMWELLGRLGGDRETLSEAKVVYASFLLDRDDASGAWKVIGPKRLDNDPDENSLREWYVAARAATRLGDMTMARRLYERIQQADPASPGLDELDRMTSGR
ncbi:hypothetical protein HQ535_16440 [bacterium]|nr:hypothetical protein [bacterium]